MPPIPKYSKEEIIEAAYELAREQGMDSVVARSVGAKLNTSASPIFTVFDSMDELRNEIVEKAKQAFIDYMKDVFSYTPAFKEFGMRWVKFAIDEPELYKILFNYQHLGASLFNALNKALHNTLTPMIEEISHTFTISQTDAEELFNQMVIHAHGIASYLLTDKYAFPQDQIGRSLSMVCKGMVINMKLKDGSYNDYMAKAMLEFDDTVTIKTN